MKEYFFHRSSEQPYVSNNSNLDEPKNTHILAVKIKLKYIKTSSTGLCYSKSNSKELNGYSNADYAGDTETHRLTTGYILHQ